MSKNKRTLTLNIMTVSTTFSLVAIFGTPAYGVTVDADNNIVVADASVALNPTSQGLTTANYLADQYDLNLESLPVALSSEAIAELEKIERERQAAEAAAAKKAEEEAAAQAVAMQAQRASNAPAPANTYATPENASNPALLAAALAQLGETQDCTALVERALRALGYPAGDLGTQVGEYAQFGYVVSAAEALPGDILVRPGHVGIIYSIEGDQVTGVHGGWGGNQTVVGSDGIPLSAHTIVRIP